jgi:uncharacterized CHY-type Zn-finger protein
MFSRKELKLAYVLAIGLLAVGAVCYAAFAVQPPDEPLRLLFRTTAGKVLFDHKVHHSVSGYGVSCGDCHHTLSEDEYEDAQSCSECHDPDEGDEEVPKRADAFHQQCIGCHEQFEAGPIECAQCHVM